MYIDYETGNVNYWKLTIYLFWRIGVPFLQTTQHAMLMIVSQTHFTSVSEKGMDVRLNLISQFLAFMSEKRSYVRKLTIIYLSFYSLFPTSKELYSILKNPLSMGKSERKQGLDGNSVFF